MDADHWDSSDATDLSADENSRHDILPNQGAFKLGFLAGGLRERMRTAEQNECQVNQKICVCLKAEGQGAT
jgi:hypothetical protein